MKKTATDKAKAEVKVKVSKASAIKAKPEIKPKEQVVAKKTVSAKVKAEVKVKTKPKAKVSKVSVIKPKPEVKPKKKVADVKVSKVSAVKTKPVTKVEKNISGKGAVTGKQSLTPVSPSLKSGTVAKPALKKDEADVLPRAAERVSLKRSKARLKIFLPGQDLLREEEIFFGGLPEEYGENSISALVVDPNTVFVDWEVIPKDIADKDGDLNLRFYDVTGIEFNEWNAHAVIDVLINKRVGNGFFDIRMPGRDVVVAVGLLNAGNDFMPVVRSEMVSFPDLLTFDELGIVQKLFESGIPVGY